jgi:hypothetical protein
MLAFMPVITREMTVFEPVLNYSGARTRKAGRPCIDVQVDARFDFKSFPATEIFPNFQNYSGSHLTASVATKAPVSTACVSGRVVAALKTRPLTQAVLTGVPLILELL